METSAPSTSAEKAPKSSGVSVPTSPLNERRKKLEPRVAGGPNVASGQQAGFFGKMTSISQAVSARVEQAGYHMPTFGGFQSSPANNITVLVVDSRNSGADWSKHLNNRRLKVKSDDGKDLKTCRVEVADIDDIVVYSNIGNSDNLMKRKSCSVMINHGPVAGGGSGKNVEPRIIHPDFVFIRQKVKSCNNDCKGSGSDLKNTKSMKKRKNAFMGLANSGLYSIASMKSLYTFEHPSLMFGEMNKLAQKHSLDKFPLIQQAFYPSASAFQMLLNDGRVDWCEFPCVLKICKRGGSSGLMRLQDIQQLQDIIGVLAMTSNEDCILIQPFVDSKFDLILQKIGKNYRAFKRKSTIASNWKVGGSDVPCIMEEITPVPEKYKMWLNLVAGSQLFMEWDGSTTLSQNGQVDKIICQLEAVVDKSDDKEYIFGVQNSTSFSLMGETQEQDKKSMADLIIESIEENFKSGGESNEDATPTTDSTDAIARKNSKTSEVNVKSNQASETSPASKEGRPSLTRKESVIQEILTKAANVASNTSTTRKEKSKEGVTTTKTKKSSDLKPKEESSTSKTIVKPKRNDTPKQQVTEKSNSKVSSSLNKESQNSQQSVTKTTNTTEVTIEKVMVAQSSTDSSEAEESLVLSEDISESVSQKKATTSKLKAMDTDTAKSSSPSGMRNKKRDDQGDKTKLDKKPSRIKELQQNKDVSYEEDSSDEDQESENKSKIRRVQSEKNKPESAVNKNSRHVDTSSSEGQEDDSDDESTIQTSTNNRHKVLNDDDTENDTDTAVDIAEDSHRQSTLTSDQLIFTEHEGQEGMTSTTKGPMLTSKKVPPKKPPPPSAESIDLALMTSVSGSKPVDFYDSSLMKGLSGSPSVSKEKIAEEEEEGEEVVTIDNETDLDTMKNLRKTFAGIFGESVG